MTDAGISRTEDLADDGWDASAVRPTTATGATNRLSRLLLRRDGDDHLLRAAMVVVFAWFDRDKWQVEEIRQPVPFITAGPLILWTVPALGIRGTSILLEDPVLPTFVQMHGLPDNLHIYGHLRTLFAAAGRRVVTFDFPEFGQSDKPRDRFTGPRSNSPISRW